MLSRTVLTAFLGVPLYYTDAGFFGHAKRYNKRDNFFNLL